MGKLVVSLVLPVLLCAHILAEDMPVVTQAMVHHINTQSQWKASLDWVGDMTIAQARHLLLGSLPDYLSSLPIADIEEQDQYIVRPSSFDSRDKWEGCVGPIRDQGNCGSCWAFAATGTLADRFCIQQGVHVLLSPQWLVSCDYTTHGCNGGNMTNVWGYMSQVGVPEDTCDPYTSGLNNQNGVCDASCPLFYTAETASLYSGPSAMQAAIQQGGPIHTHFQVFQDFMSYSSGIYTYTAGAFLGWHAVRVVGWGYQQGTSFWIVANSWSQQWGMDGFFWIAFGQCQFDVGAVAGNAGSIYVPK